MHFLFSLLVVIMGRLPAALQGKQLRRIRNRFTAALTHLVREVRDGKE
jgi:hypothetical protein